jgi:hypothetical protein
MDNHTLIWPTKPENFMRFGTTCVFCGRDPMEYPIYIPVFKSLGKGFRICIRCMKVGNETFFDA